MKPRCQRLSQKSSRYFAQESFCQLYITCHFIAIGIELASFASFFGILFKSFSTNLACMQYIFLKVMRYLRWKAWRIYASFSSLFSTVTRSRRSGSSRSSASANCRSCIWRRTDFGRWLISSAQRICIGSTSE